jgi:RHS repeat-associated core domain
VQALASLPKSRSDRGSASPRADWVCREAQLPNGESRREHYDFLGRIQRVDEPDGSWLRFYYDQGRLSRIEHSSGESVEYLYGDREITARTSRSVTTIRSDEPGYPCQIVTAIDGHTFTVDYQRGARGKVKAIRYPQSADWLSCEGEHIRCGNIEYLTLETDRKRGTTTVRFSNGTVSREELRGRTPVRIAHFDASGTTSVSLDYKTDEQSRITQAGAQTFRYRDDGSLETVEPTTDAQLIHDRLGRLIRREDSNGVSVYSYNLFGQLAHAVLPDGAKVEYVYDGFGRLIGRFSGAEKLYFAVDVDGRRMATLDSSGRIIHSFLWLGLQCVARIDGPVGNPLTASFHRVHGARLAGIGDAAGAIAPVPYLDPYGADAPCSLDTPSFASLFGDPATGLLHAGSRWYDPTRGEFITPDSWLGTHALSSILRRGSIVLDLLPGGTGRALSAADAYAWCHRDPINFIDPNGHNWLGLIFSFISAFLWEMQLTSLSLQMEAINLVWEVLQWVPLFRPAWDWDGYWQTSIANGNLPMASYRLMVPFAIPLNGLLRVHDRGWTLGSVIWVRGDKWRTVERTSKRNLLVVSNAGDYRAAIDRVAADMFRVRNPHCVGTANVNPSGTQLTGVTLTTPAGAAIADVFQINDWVLVQLASSPSGTGEPRPISGFPSASDINLGGGTLPTEYAGQAVQITRLDISIVRLESEGKSIARTVTSARGDSIHFAAQIPEGFPTSNLSVTEFMPAGRRRSVIATAPLEARIIHVPQQEQLAGFSSGDMIRIASGRDYFARTVDRTRPPLTLVLDTPLPNPTPPADYSRLEVVRLEDSGASVNGQTASGSLVEAGNLTDLERLDGLVIENTGAPTVTAERRIVIELLLRCTITALPNDLLGVAIFADRMIPDASKQASGTVTSNTVITADAGEASRFENGQPVRVRKAPGTDHFSTVTVNENANTFTLADPLPGGFVAGDRVTVTLLTAGRSFELENAAAPGTDVLVRVDAGTDLAQNDILRIRKASDASVNSVRQIQAAPVMVARVDSAMPPTHTAGLTVKRFTPVQPTLTTGARAPLVQMKFTVTGTNPYTSGDMVHVSNNEEAIGQIATVAGPDFFLTDPIEYVGRTNNVAVQAVEPTGATSTDAQLDEALILIPSDPDADPITHREAFEQHEMRHVWQGAVWGPFLLSLPIPWLVDFGFSFTNVTNSVSAITRHCGVGGLDSLFALIAWGIGKAFGAEPSGAELRGEVADSERKVIAFPADASEEQVGAFTEGSPVTISKTTSTDGFSTFNVVQNLNTAEKKITLRFSLEEDKFSTGETVKAEVSPFEKIRKQVNTWFSLNLEQLWSQHIPVAWGRALSRLLNRDSWFPLGIYPLSLLVAGGNEDRLPNEQDAAYHSGDLYTSIVLARPNEVFVGQFTRIFGFLHPRGVGDSAVGLSDINARNFLRVELPAGAAISDVAGAVDAGVSGGVQAVRLREQYYIPMHQRTDNVIGALFVASRPGDYVLRAPGDLAPGTDIVFKFAFDVSFVEQRTIHVRALTVTPSPTPADPVYETEEVRFTINGDPSAQYRLRYRGTPPTPAGDIRDLRFTAPVLPAGPSPITHNLEITATYDAGHSVFRGQEQQGDVALSEAERTNRCQDLDVPVARIDPPTIPAVTAGTRQTFTMPIAPRNVRVTSARPPGAALNAVVINGTGRPAELTFIAPDAVSAPFTVTFEMDFGSPPHQKTVSASVQVNPA